MNSGGGFGSGFGQQSGEQPFGSSSVFGTSSTGTGSAVFGVGFGSETSGFGAGSTGTSGFGFSGTGSSGFGSGSTGTSGFGSGSTVTPGFGSGSTVTSGFGSGSTGTSGFGPGSTGTSGFGSGSTGTSGFRAGNGMSGTSGFGAGSSGMPVFQSNIGTSVFDSGTSGFGSGTTSPGFGSASTGTSGFGTITKETSVFGSSSTGTSGFDTGTSGFKSNSSGTTIFGSTDTGTFIFGSGGTVTSGLGSGSTGTHAFGPSSTSISRFGSVSTGASVFGSSTITPSFGTGTIGTGSPAFGSGVFGTSASSGSTSMVSGGFSSGNSQQGLRTGANNSPAFGSGSFVFGASKNAGFGTGVSSSSSGFGSGAPLFGTSTTGITGFGTSTAGITGFGTSTTDSSGFGPALSKPAFETGASMFGTGIASSTGFGAVSSQGAGSSVFGSASSGGFGTGGAAQTGFGTGGTTQLGFGTGGTTQSRFGTGGTTQSGFGTGGTIQSGFGTRGTTQSGFGTGGTTQSGFATGGTTQSGFGTGGTTQSVFATGGTTQSGFGTGGITQSGFGAGTQSGFGTGGTTQSGFGTGGTTQSGFGTGGTIQSGFGAGGTTQSGFGTGGTTQSGFGTGGITQSGFGAGGTTQSGFLTGGTTQSGFGTGGTTQSGLSGTPSGFGSGGSSQTGFTAGSSVFGTAQSSSSIGTSSQETSGFVTSSGFGPVPGGFGISTTQPVFSLPTSVFSLTAGGSTGTTHTSSGAVFGALKDATPVAQPLAPGPFSMSSSFPSAAGTAATFGIFGAAKDAATSIGTTSTSDSGGKGLLFPAAAAVSGKSVFGGATSLAASQGASGSTSVFGAPQRTDSSAKSSTQTSSASAFGGQPSFSSTASFSFVQSGMKTETGTSVFGVGKSSDTLSGSQDSAVKTKGLFGKKSGVESSVFGGRLDTGSGGSVFGGKKEPAATFGFSVASDKTSSGFGVASFSGQSQKRGAEGGAEDEDATDSKRGRGEEKDDRDVQGTPEHLKLHRLSSAMDNIANKTTITCKRVPANLNKSTYLRTHFSNFGKVKSVRAMPVKQTATIQFETHEGAAAAKKHGARLSPRDPPVTIFFRSSKSDRSPSMDEPEQGPSYSRSKHSSLQEGGFLRRNASQHALTLPRAVADELASMGAGNEQAAETEYHILDRPGVRDRLGQEGRGQRSVSPSRHATPTPATSAATSSNQPKPAKIDAATFANLQKTSCMTTTDKIAVLDVRDKLLKQTRDKQQGSALQRKAFVGTCPDMCPEKERFYREDVRRLAIYEIIPGSSTLTGSTSLVDHSKAVKEYSRSSADQDEPLPHELRPAHVLTMTMNYLLSEIADRGEDGKWSEWYDFLWNRTRGVRKDITQQQLCSREVVELIEKCARFHIYCSERLCTEDMMVFDSKINNENLTKCLQTLKELYADLENKHGMFCPNEAEFRAYMVLMNLNEGDTLREVQQLRPDVRDSREIDFAVKAYSALNSNNYVRFFRLLGTASFLNACVLHRYFNQMRARALQIMLRAHTKGPRQKSVFPLLELVRLLAFENEEQVCEFCAYYGLLAEGPDLVLDRSMYIEPESSIPSWRAQSLIESKQMVSVGEVINGEILQPVQLPTPQCSFDEQGRFIGSLEGLTDVVGAEAKARTVQPPQVAVSQSPAVTTEIPAAPTITQAVTPSQSQAVAAASQQALVSNEAVKMAARDLFWEVIDDFAHDVSQSLYNAIQFYLASDKVFAEEIMAEVNANMVREVSQEVLDSEQSLLLQQKEAERRERENRLTEAETDGIVDSVVREEVMKLVQAEVREACAKDHADRIERCANDVSLELLGEITLDMTRQVSKEFHAVDVVARLQMLSELQEAVELQRTSHWFALWRKAYKSRQRQKRAMLDFPCAPSMQRTSHLLHSLCPDRPETYAVIPEKAAVLINRRAQLSLLSPLEAERRSLMLTAHLSLASLLNSLQRTRAWQPLRLASILNTPLTACVSQWPENMQKELGSLGIQWKMLLSLPGEMETVDDDGNADDSEFGQRRGELMKTLSLWLRAKFTHGEMTEQQKQQPEILSLYSVQLASDQDTGLSGVRCSVCVRSVPEFATAKPNQQTTAHCQAITKGASAIMFLLPHFDSEDDTLWLSARLRLAKLLEAKPAVPPVPLVLLLPHSATTTAASKSITDTTTTRLNVDQFFDKGLVSEVAVVELPIKPLQPADMAIVAPMLQAQVSEAVKWLASRMPEPPQLRGECLGELVEDMLTQHFFTPVLQDVRTRRQWGKLHQSPNMLIGLYNSVLDHVALALTSPSLQDISWPAPEFVQTSATIDGIPHPRWNSKSHQADVYQLVAGLRLPWFRYQEAEACDWSHVCRDVWSYVRALAKSCGTSSVSLTSRISFLLARACSAFENLCSLTQNEDSCTPTYVNAPWADIIIACINFRLELLHSWKEEGTHVVCGNLQVFYEEEDMEDFEPPASWLRALLDTDNKESSLVAETIQLAVNLHTQSTPSSPDDLSMDSDSDADTAAPAEHDQSRSIDSLRHQTPSSRTQQVELIPGNMRTALGTSQNLLIHVEEERRQTQDFEKYLERALKGDTTDTNFSNVSFSNMSPVGSDFESTHYHAYTPAGFRQAYRNSITPLSMQLSTVPVRACSRGLGLSPSHSAIRHGHTPTSRRLLPSYERGQTLSSSYNRLSSTSTREPLERERNGERETEEPWLAPHPSMSETVEHLKEDLQSQKRASDLFEKRLQALLES